MARVDAHLLEAFDRECSVRIIADTAEHADPRAEACKPGRDVSSHAARRLLLNDAVHLPVPRRQPIDLDHDVDVEVTDTEKQRELFSGLRGGAQASPLAAPVIKPTTIGPVRPAMGRSATFRPRRSTTIRSQTSNTCSMLWLMSTIAMP